MLHRPVRTFLILSVLAFLVYLFVVFYVHSYGGEIYDDNKNVIDLMNKNRDKGDLVQKELMELKEQLKMIDGVLEEKDLEIEKLKEEMRTMDDSFEKEINTLKTELEILQSNTSITKLKKKSQLLQLHRQTTELSNKIEALNTTIKDLDLFKIAIELDKLKTQLQIKIEEEGKSKNDQFNKKFILQIPGFGPNNQYIGMIETMLIAKFLGRTFARPDFYLHAINDLDSIRAFGLTFDPEPLNEFVETISLPEYVKHCGGVINTIVWLRNPAYWTHLVELYLRHARLTYTNVVYTPNGHDLWFTSKDSLLSYFDKFSDHKCIAITFPYETVSTFTDRNSVHKYLHHSSYIKRMARNALTDMNVVGEKLLTMHWRFGEDSCAWYQSPDPQYTFCWGTTEFHFARVEDVLFTLVDFIKSSQVTHVYLAVASHYLDPKVMRAIDTEFKQQGIPYFRSKNVPTLANVTDNYYLSLIEQEISASGKLFCRSDSSTWSDYIVNWVRANECKYPFIVSLGELLKIHNKPFISFNRELNEAELKNYRRPENWWKEDNSTQGYEYFYIVR